jgi:hypothetical protein
MRFSIYFIFFLFAIGCIEPYEFVVKNTQPSLVVEGFISDKSFNETLQYPSDGRYFTIKLSTTGDVTNVRPKPVSGAFVKIVNDAGEEVEYTESVDVRGTYSLNLDIFRAVQGVKYKLHIVVEEDIYESDWEQLPTSEPPPIGEIGFKESTSQTYVMVAREPFLTTIKVITANIALNTKSTDEPIYYRWQFTPLWIYKAPLSPSVVSPGHICWATHANYLRSYALQVDRTGGYKKDLFTIPTVRNERIFEDFSVLIVQHALSERNYFFYKEMSDQNESSVLMDIPPFNLQSNLHAVNNDKKVSGFFGVVKEQATRWYFNKSQLSYTVVNTLKADCLVDYGPGGPAPECLDCREYSFGQSTEVKPIWWRK